MLAIVYRKVDNLELLKNVSQCHVEILNRKTKEVRTLLRNKGQGVCVEFNPRHQVTRDQTIWTFRFGVIQELQWDPSERSWQRQGSMPLNKFFNYTIEREYQIRVTK